MASIEFIQKRIEGKEKEVAKLEKKLERIMAAKATGWEVNPYYYREDDIRWTTNDLNRAKEALEKYRANLDEEQRKANSRNIKVIIDFLDAWKKRVTDYYNKRFETYPEAKEAFDKEMAEFPDYYEWRRLKRDEYDKYLELKERRDEIVGQFDFMYGCLTPYIERVYNYDTGRYDSWKFDSEKLEKDLTQEANRKYDFIIERTLKIVGEITDAAGLQIGAKGDLNGFIVGPKGTAKVQTIGAGGYNIQCFHFRTLINKVGA